MTTIEVSPATRDELKAIADREGITLEAALGDRGRTSVDRSVVFGGRECARVTSLAWSVLADLLDLP